MRVLITGGAGFIGSYISKILLDYDHEVVIYDNLSKGKINSIDKKALFVQGDLANQALLEKILSGIDCVIHLAALIEVNESVKRPLLYAQNNIEGTIYLLQAMENSGVRKIIFSSTATVYGFPEKLPLTEDAPVMAVNPYGATKVAIENFLKSYFFNQKFDVVILRYFNPYGPGESHEPETHAVPNFIKAALKNEPIPLYWNGEQVRDFIYVEDLARAHTDVLGLKGWNVFNVGTNQGVKVIDVVRKIEQILGKKVEVKDLGERAGDVPANYASSELLTKTTGWKPKYSLEEGLRLTVEYFKGLSKN